MSINNKQTNFQSNMWLSSLQNMVRIIISGPISIYDKIIVDARKHSVILFVYGRKRRWPSMAMIVEMDGKTTAIQRKEKTT
jgi:hypothetical protein